MKKIIALLLLVTFVFGGIPVSAEDNINNEAVKNYQQTKEKYNLVSGEWKNLRADYINAKTKLKKFNQLSDEEQDIHFEIYQNFLLKTIERLESYLEVFEGWVSRTDLSEEKQIAIMDEINEVLSKLKEINLDVKDATTIDELKESAKQIRSYWQEIQPKLKRAMGEGLAHRVNKILIKSDRLSSHLHEKLNALDQTESDVKKMQELLDDFDEKIELANEKYELAKEKYKKISTVQDANDFFKQSKKHLLEANSYLRDAHKDLRKLVKAYRLHTNVVPIQDLTEVKKDELSPQ